MVTAKLNSIHLDQVLALALTVCFIMPPSAESVGESAILEFLEQLRVRMCHPIPQLGLPALDPLQITHVKKELNNKYLKDFTGSVTDFKITGLSEFIISEIRISTIRKSIFNITLPLTALQSVYDAKGSVAYIVNLAGDGEAEAHLKDLSLRVLFNLKSGIYLGIRNLSIMITAGELYIDFENLLEDERINDFFHALVNELGLELLGDLWTYEKAVLESYIQERVNAYIGQYTINDIITIIGGSGGDEPIFGSGPPGDCKEAATTTKTSHY